MTSHQPRIYPPALGLAALSQSIFASLGVSGATDPLAFENRAERVALLLVDGMGLAAVDAYASEFPIFQSLREVTPLSSHFPSTTATNLASLGTGELPGVHGMLGYTIRVPHSGEPGRLLNALKWDERVDPLTWQKVPTLFERAASEGVRVSHISSKRYEGSGFTRAALRGAQYLGANYIPEMIVQAKIALAKPSSFAYLYLNNIDSAGHNDGVGSDKYLAAFAIVADLIEGLIKELPTGTNIFVTADHGMVNVADSIILGKDNDLMSNVTLVGGEPRARHIYLNAGSAPEVVAQWREYFGAKVDIFTKADAHDLFGPNVSTDSLDRMGDIIAVPKGGLILIDPQRIPQESSMIGHHGGMTDIEVKIPLLQY